MNRIFSIKEYGAAEGGTELCTQAIQRAVDAAAEVQGEVLIPVGIWLTGAIFLHSHMRFRIEEGAVLLGVTDESAYPMTFTRVAGVEMEWPAGVLNVSDAEGVHIYGKGTIDGQGEYWWKKYWGEDGKSGMRLDYEKRGLRWALDYDCLRVRNVVVFRSRDVILEDFHSVRSGFWNIHVCYSEDVEVRGLQISDNAGPGTDGIDIDSCRGVVVENCDISCSDDNICIKSGRDGDGLRVNRICEDVVIRNCVLREGAGVTLGSETSGGIRNVFIHHNNFFGTRSGFRMKSARTRGGVMEQITVDSLTMTDVRCPFSFEFDWYPAYGYCQIPADYEGEVPERWKALMQPVPPEKAIPEAHDIIVKNVTAKLSAGYPERTQAFNIRGLDESPIQRLRFENIEIQARESGKISNVRKLELENVRVIG